MQPFGKQLVAGDTWQWALALDYDSATWTAKYFFRGAASLDIVGVHNESGFVFKATPAQTAAFAPGTYSWQLVVVSATDRIEIARGSVEVLANIEAGGVNFDGRSYTKRILDAIEAVLEGRASRSEKYYQVGSRSLGLMEPTELLDLRDRLRRDYRAELIASGQLEDDDTLYCSFGGVR